MAVLFSDDVKGPEVAFLKRHVLFKTLFERLGLVEQLQRSTPDHCMGLRTNYANARCKKSRYSAPACEYLIRN